MENTKIPTQKNGKVCYIDIPAIDIKISSTFYQNVFGWNIRKRSDGQISFDDPVGEVSGTWNLCTEIQKEPGILIYIMVDNVANAIELIVANGGNVVDPMTENGSAIIARFSDPAGNVFGLYQEASI